MRVHQVLLFAGALLLPSVLPAVAADDPEHVVLDYIASWNMHDASRAAGDLAYDVTYFEPTAAQSLNGRDAVRAAMLASFGNVAPDAVWMLSGDQLLDGDKVAFEWEFVGTNTGMWADGSAPTGKHIVLHGMSIFRVDRGKIVYQANYFDRDAAIKAFGTM